jgi:hypothetical protein
MSAAGKIAGVVCSNIHFNDRTVENVRDAIVRETGNASAGVVDVVVEAVMPHVPLPTTLEDVCQHYAEIVRQQAGPRPWGAAWFTAVWGDVYRKHGLPEGYSFSSVRVRLGQILRIF